jgi:hypothetical protein
MLMKMTTEKTIKTPPIDIIMMPILLGLLTAGTKNLSIAI